MLMLVNTVVIIMTPSPILYSPLPPYVQLTMVSRKHWPFALSQQFV